MKVPIGRKWRSWCARITRTWDWPRTYCLNWNPSRATSIGLGYRSSIDHTLEGTAFTLHPTFGPLNGAIKAGVTLPEIVTLSLRQELSPQWRVLGTIEYSHWDRVQKLDIVCANNVGPASLCPSNGGLVRSLDLGWHDGWFFALGAEHDYSERLRLRAGIAYELSPVQNPDERSLRVPDADRFWASIGATYKWSEKIALDFAYTHIFSVGDTDIDRTENGLRFIGSADSNIDIVSASLKIKLGNDAHGAPLK